MRVSKHAEVRMAQRGISHLEAGRIIALGMARPAPGGADRYVLTDKELHGALQYHKDQIRQIERLKRKAVVASPDGLVLTVEHVYRGRRMATP